MSRSTDVESLVNHIKEKSPTGWGGMRKPQIRQVRRRLTLRKTFEVAAGMASRQSGRRGPCGPRPPTPPDVRFRIRRFTLKIEVFVVDPAAT